MSAERLSRRERQIVDALYAMGEGSAREIADAMREPESLDSIRVTLRVLEQKGHVRHRAEGKRHVYAPVQSPEQARRQAWTRLTRTFFGGSASRALLTFLDLSGDRLDDRDLDELSAWVSRQSRRRKSSS